MIRTSAPHGPSERVKCACQSCHCQILPGTGVVRDGKLFCSSTCAYDCTSTTCVCIHRGCGGEGRENQSQQQV